MARTRFAALVSVTLVAVAAACSGNTAPATPGTQPGSPAAAGAGGTTAGAGTQTLDTRPAGDPPAPPPIAMAPAVTADPVTGMSLDDLNRGSTLKPVFFVYDSDSLDDAAREALADNAQQLKKYRSWVITIEGHCDERGSAEYNLALGDRRAQVARNFLLSLGVEAERVHTVSYGKEFPFDAGHEESNWANNRRAQFVVTAK